MTMQKTKQDMEQNYFDATANVPEYTIPDITDKEIEMMLLYRLLSPEQQEQIMNRIEQAGIDV